MLTADYPDVDERLLEQLRAMPYDLDINEDGQFVLTPQGWPGWTREEISQRGVFSEDFNGWKVETNAQRQILLMTTPRLDHQEFEGEITRLLYLLLSNGRPLSECGVITSNGTKEPDVVWASNTMRRAHRQEASFTKAPELCVEVISPSNTRREINEKRRLYFEAGAQEVWICGKVGAMTFYTNNETTVARSLFCPEFPVRVDPFSA